MTKCKCKCNVNGLPFTVRTDHSALQWLMSFREPEGQVARWLEELQAYNFTVVHRAGAQHSNADALSRRACAADGCHHCERRESRELELCEEEQQQQQLKAVRRAEMVDCRELQMVSVGRAVSGRVLSCGGRGCVPD